MAELRKNPEDSIDKVLRQFKKKLKEEGLIEELRKREFYEKPSEARKKKIRAAIRRQQRKSDRD
ncbi:MAG: 30S ribosomal protein S21 [Candidatus Margulisiibacteriota bacterium]|nr:MAG: 30S ribosomal protein S21 [Candidatus Margulisbacteria bacterium GWD2_39_127]OGI03594.1 MAG: 30S ribosomal protein S21 [Candidatus Margulisbacteria bacterium GWF2_38_17]OGI11098.1 MAG: 30S ribosomal protein S21 [Candidatus Margulisbacteria bacterium GWE2_39_32]PZM78154.1 MAG: 30S ribosomal protein S21 [Candidatus Margulisiibacteriota bacterium]HAR62302.1 30S ribosomal protein S21 [Candidatus Margulisiibacteriota bacterium]